MSLASCSTRAVSRPARTRDAGLHVDSARTINSSPLPTWSTGSPAASYQPIATVFGVGISVNVLPGEGAGQDMEAPSPPAGSSVPIDDGVRHPSAHTPPMIVATVRARIIIASSPVDSDLRAIQFVSQRAHAHAQEIGRACSIPARRDQRARNQLDLGFIYVERRQHHRVFGNRRRDSDAVAISSEEISCDTHRRRTAPRPTQPKTLGVERMQWQQRLAGENYRSLHRMLQLADITWPMVSVQQLERLWRD